MAGYRCVNFFDLCRLCSSVAGDKNVHIHANEGLLKKINECLSITLSEKDKLPKIICPSCQEYVEIFSEFRKSCFNAQKMLESCLNSAKLRNGGQVYIKDETPVKKVLKPIRNPSPTKIIPNINIITTPTKSLKKNVISPNQPDFLSSIMQAVGIQTGEEMSENISQPSVQPTIQTLPQYTLTLDGNTLKTGQIQYKIENAGNILAQSPIITTKNLQDIQNQHVTLNQVDEFLKLKQKPSITVKKDTSNTASTDEPKDKKPKFNLILQATSQKQVPKVQQSQILSNHKAQILNIEKILPVVNQASPTKQVVVPIMVRTTEGRNTIAPDATAQLFTQALSLTTANQASENKNSIQQPFFMQMKLQSNSDGQLTFTPAPANPQQIQLSLSPQQLQQLSFQTSQPQQTQSTATQSSTQNQVISTAQDIQTQTQGSISEISEKNDSQEDEVFHDTFDNDYYPAEEENETNNAHEKVQNNNERKTPQLKKSVKTIRPVKLKCKTEASSNNTEIPPINPEHCEMARKQLDQLTSFNNKRVENETIEKSNDINLTLCDVCKKVFKRKEFLMQHLKSHIGLRPFKCEEAMCNKSFSRKEHLLRHISSHTGKKEFTCNICNKLFSRKDNLNKHRRIHPDANQQYSKQISRIIKNETTCDEKIDEDVKNTEIKTVVKKAKVKMEKKEETTKSMAIQNPAVAQQSSQQQSKIVQVQQIGVKNDNQQQIILSMSQAQAMISQQSKAVYTIPTNFILNPHSTFVTTNNVGNLVGKFETQ